jgi:hypothetical protein
VQVDKVRVAEQAAHGGLPYARFPERVHILGVADEQRHLGGLRGLGEWCLRPRADRGHSNPELAKLLKHAHPKPVIPQQDDTTTRSRVSPLARHRTPSSVRFGRIPRSTRP